MHQAAIELVNNVHKEKMKALSFLKQSAHTDAQMKTQKEQQKKELRMYVLRFLDAVESIISIPQWR